MYTFPLIDILFSTEKKKQNKKAQSENKFGNSFTSEQQHYLKNHIT